MTEQVLTDDEKNALLDGVSSGAVEVHASGGPQYASVRPFEVNARSRMVTNSYPRLQTINRLFADRLSVTAASFLQCDLEVLPTGIEVCTWSDYCLRQTEPGIGILFSPAPLAGHALVALRGELVGHLVDSFFGSEVGAGRAGSGPFTPGELQVANRFCDVLLSAVQEIWQPLIELKPERTSTETNLDLVDLARDADPIIGSGFELSFAGHRGTFQLLWPETVIAPLLPKLEGRPEERKAADEARWEKAIRRRLADAPIRITTRIGDARHALGELAVLSPGDVLIIESPRAATVLAGGVPIIKGRFGVYEGRNAVEATAWLVLRQRDIDGFSES